MSVSVVPPLANPYVARELVRRDMVTLFERCRAERRPCLMNLHGLEGLGVSSLASQFYRDNQREIGGPLIWLAGRAVDGTPATPAQLLGQILTDLGVPAADQGASESERARACRRLLARNPCQVVIDDLAERSQIEHLSSLDAPGLVFIVTTPFSRRDLRADGFREFAPEFLSEAHARELFAAGCADPAGSLSESTVTGLLDQCGGLPLLVKVLAAQLDGRPQLAEPLLVELRGTRLDVLEFDDERRMRGFFDVAYARLSDAIATAARQLSLVPGPDFGVDVAAAALDCPVSAAHLTLATLGDHNLVVSPRPGRYTFHPVVRGDARSRATEDDRNAIRRAASWYVREALVRSAGMSGRWWVMPAVALLRELVGDGSPTSDGGDARAWFDDELLNLTAAAVAADREGLPELVWPLCIASWKYLHLHGLYTEWVLTNQLGLAAAKQLRESALVMQLASQLGSAHLGLGETRTAGEYFAESLAAARTLGRSRDGALGEQSALEWLGKVAAAEERYDDALAGYQESREFAAAAAAEIGAEHLARIEGILRLQEARARLGQKDWFGAVRDAETAVGFFDGHENETDNQAKSRLVLGQALVGSVEHERAAGVLDEALVLFEQGKQLRWQAEACVWLARALTPRGSAGRVDELYRRARDYYESVGDDKADEIQSALDSSV